MSESHQTQDESVQGDDVVLPHHVVEDLDALVELLAPRRRGELVHQEVRERAHVGHQRAGPDPLQHPETKNTRTRTHTPLHWMRDFFFNTIVSIFQWRQVL